jgi:hypothetical protein
MLFDPLSRRLSNTFIEILTLTLFLVLVLDDCIRKQSEDLLIS